MLYRLLFCSIVILVYHSGITQSARKIKNQQTIVSGETISSRFTDTVELILYPEFSNPDPEVGTLMTKTVVIKNHHFYFQLPPLERPAYVSLYLNAARDSIFNQPSKPLIDHFLIEPGDSIYVQYKNDTPSFSGRGANKFTWCLQQAAREQTFPRAPLFYKSPESYLQAFDSIVASHAALLDHHKPALSATGYAILKGDLVARNRFFLYSMFRYLGFVSDDSTRKKESFEVYRRSLYQQHPDTVHSEQLALSKNYPDWIIFQHLSDLDYADPNNRPSAQQVMNWLITSFRGELREKLLLTYLRMENGHNRMDQPLVDSASPYFSTLRYRKPFDELNDTFHQGAQMLDYAFVDKQGRKRRLSDFKGKVVFLDMWFSGCGACVYVASELPKVEHAFAGDTNVVFMSVSIDRDRKRWMTSTDSAGKGYKHYTTSSTLYVYTGGTGGNNSFIPKYVPGNAYPTLLLVDKCGKLYSSHPPRPWPETDGAQQLTDMIRQALNEQSKCQLPPAGKL